MCTVADGSIYLAKPVNVADGVVPYDPSETDHEKLIIMRLLGVMVVTRSDRDQVYPVVGAVDILGFGEQVLGRYMLTRGCMSMAHVAARTWHWQT